MNTLFQHFLLWNFLQDFKNQHRNFFAIMNSTVKYSLTNNFMLYVEFVSFKSKYKIISLISNNIMLVRLYLYIEILFKH
jgi:hypothetical protein